VSGVVYDTGALVAAERRHRGLWALHEQSLASGLRPIVPVVVLAQAPLAGLVGDAAQLR
jgi:hypothetical protein